MDCEIHFLIVKSSVVHRTLKQNTTANCVIMIYVCVLWRVYALYRISYVRVCLLTLKQRSELLTFCCEPCDCQHFKEVWLAKGETKE